MVSLLEPATITLSAEKPPEFCLICNKIIPEDELSSIIEEERVKFANIFVTCFTLDTDKLSGELGHVNFCVGCQTKLEEWEFDQEQINKLLYRASVLKATLTATLLEFAQDLRETKEAESVHDEIRKLVRNEYNVRVKVKRLKPAVREPIKKIVVVVENNNDNKSSNNNTRRFHRSSSPPVKKIGRCEYLYKSAIPFSYNARKYQCGLCSATVSISPDGFGWTYMLKHIRRLHKDAYEAALEEESENHALNQENNFNIAQVFQGGLWDDFVPQPGTESAEGDALKEQSDAAGDLSSSHDDLTDLHDDPLSSHDDPSNSPDAFDPSSALQVKLDIPEDQAESTATDLDGTNNSMEVDIQSYQQESPEDKSSRQSQSRILPRHRTTVQDLGGGRYKYGSHTFTLEDGKGVCGVCGTTYGGTITSARHNVVQHIRIKHGVSSHRSRTPKENQTRNFTIEVQPVSTSKLLFSNKNLIIEPIPNSTTTTEVPSSDISPPDVNSETTPNFDVSKVRQLGPGEYIYRNKVPFTFSNGRFTCGFCWRIYEGNAVIAKHQLLSHLRVKHLNSGQSAASPTKSRPELPGIFSYKNKVQYELKDGAYHCSLCRLKFAGPVLAATKNKLFAHIEERHAATLEDLPEIRIRTGNAIFAPEETENYPISIVSRNDNPIVVNSTVRKLGPDEFLYRNKYRFSVRNGVYQCGNCTSTYTSNTYGRHSILRHIRKNHEVRQQLAPKPQRIHPAKTAANLIQNGPNNPATSTATSSPSSSVPEGGSLIHKDIREVAPGRYEYDGKPFWFSNGKFGCGLCPTLWVSSVGPANILLHLKTAHVGYRPMPTVTTPSPGVRTAASGSPASPQVLPQGQSSCSVPNTAVGEGSVEESIGQFPSSRVQQTGPGQYLYRNKVPFAFVDGTFTCGVCSQHYGGNPLIAKHQMLSHVRVFHAGKSAEDLQNEIGGHILVGEKSIEATPTFHRLDVKELEPGKYVFRGAILFTYKDAKFTCGMCSSGFSGPLRSSMNDIVQHMNEHLDNRQNYGTLVNTTTARTIQNVTQNTQLSVVTAVQQTSQASQKLRMLPPEVTELGAGKYIYRNKLFTLQRGKFWCYYCPSSWFAVVESWEPLLEHLRIVHNAGATANYPMDSRNQMNPLAGSNSFQSQMPQNFQSQVSQSFQSQVSQSFQSQMSQNCQSQLSQSIARESSPRILGQDNRAMGMPVITSVQGYHNPSMISPNSPTLHHSSSGLSSGMSVPQLVPLNQPMMPQNPSQPRHSPNFVPQNQSLMPHNPAQPRHSPTVVSQGVSIPSLVAQSQSMAPLTRPMTPQARHSPSMPPGMSIPAMVSQNQQQFMPMAAPGPSQARHSPAGSTVLASGHLPTRFNSVGGSLTDENISFTSLLTSPIEYSPGVQPNSSVQQQSPMQCPPVSTSSGPMLPTSSNSYLSVTNSMNSEVDTFSSVNDVVGDIQSYLPSNESEYLSMNTSPLQPVSDASLGFPSLDTNTLDSSFLDLI